MRIDSLLSKFTFLLLLSLSADLYRQNDVHPSSMILPMHLSTVNGDVINDISAAAQHGEVKHYVKDKYDQVKDNLKARQESNKERILNDIDNVKQHILDAGQKGKEMLHQHIDDIAPNTHNHDQSAEHDHSHGHIGHQHIPTGKDVPMRHVSKETETHGSADREQRQHGQGQEEEQRASRSSESSASLYDKVKRDAEKKYEAAKQRQRQKEAEKSSNQQSNNVSTRSGIPALDSLIDRANELSKQYDVASTHDMKQKVSKSASLLQQQLEDIKSHIDVKTFGYYQDAKRPLDALINKLKEKDNIVTETVKAKFDNAKVTIDDSIPSVNDVKQASKTAANHASQATQHATEKIKSAVNEVTGSGSTSGTSVDEKTLSGASKVIDSIKEKLVHVTHEILHHDHHGAGEPEEIVDRVGGDSVFASVVKIATGEKTLDQALHEPPHKLHGSYVPPNLKGDVPSISNTAMNYFNHARNAVTDSANQAMNAVRRTVSKSTSSSSTSTLGSSNTDSWVDTLSKHANNMKQQATNAYYNARSAVTGNTRIHTDTQHQRQPSIFQSLSNKLSSFFQGPDIATGTSTRHSTAKHGAGTADEIVDRTAPSVFESLLHAIGLRDEL